MRSDWEDDATTNRALALTALKFGSLHTRELMVPLVVKVYAVVDVALVTVAPFM